MVFLFANSKCKLYLRNRLKPTKLTCTTMCRKQHKKEYRSKARLTSLCPVKEIITKRSCSQLDLTFEGKTLRSGDGKEALGDQGSLKSKAKSRRVQSLPLGVSPFLFYQVERNEHVPYMRSSLDDKEIFNSEGN